jgi:hypothetical protein
LDLYRYVAGTVERLCIFDFDDTIKIGAGRRIRVGRDVDAILKKCKEMGYGGGCTSCEFSLPTA